MNRRWVPWAGGSNLELFLSWFTGSFRAVLRVLSTFVDRISMWTEVLDTVQIMLYSYLFLLTTPALSHIAERLI